MCFLGSLVWVWLDHFLLFWYLDGEKGSGERPIEVFQKVEQVLLILYVAKLLSMQEYHYKVCKSFGYSVNAKQTHPGCKKVQGQAEEALWV